MLEDRTRFKQPKTVSTVLEREELEYLEEIRWREHLMRSEIIRRAVLEYIKNHKEGNDTFRIEDFTDPNFRAMPAMASTKEKWYQYVNKNTDRQERAHLKDIIKYVEKCIDATNWEEDHPNA